MVWDLGRAMRKKEEFESARLMDFEFRQRARAARLFARELGLEEAALARDTVTRSDAELLDSIAAANGLDRSVIGAAHQRCLANARLQLIAERGDPTPYRLG